MSEDKSGCQRLQERERRRVTSKFEIVILESETGKHEGTREMVAMLRGFFEIFGTPFKLGLADMIGFFPPLVTFSCSDATTVRCRVQLLASTNIRILPGR